MFQPETEDMLPRTAPKPTIGLTLNEPAVKPTVPEVSILFNQIAPKSTECDGGNIQQCKSKQSYASWKKSVLPKVIYPPRAERITSVTNGSNQTSPQSYAEIRSNVYPLRTVASSNAYNADTYRRSLESNVPSYCHTQDPHMVAGQPNPMLAQLQQQQHQRRSLDALSQQCLSAPPAARTTSLQTEVLTICASTQTDVCLSSSAESVVDNQQLLNKVATTQDFQQLLGIVIEMREEQQRLTRICGLLLERNYQKSTVNKTHVILKDVGTQYDENALKDIGQQRSLNAAASQDYIAAKPFEAPMNLRQKVLIANQNFQSPRPAAHSTKYTQNTPCTTAKSKPLQQPTQQQQQNYAQTEHSLVMNELALKYLPNDKLNELLNELRVTPNSAQKNATEENYAACRPGLAVTPPTPLRNIDNFDRGPSDISNASYKYLKKYRLLTEGQQIEHDPCMSPTVTQQQKQNYQSESPLAGTQRENHENILDLDAIRRQPKFS